jgi:dynactin complex subunit
MTVLEYIVQYAPALIAILLETGVAKFVISHINKKIRSEELKKVMESNIALAQQLEEQNQKLEKISKQLNKVKDNDKEI